MVHHSKIDFGDFLEDIQKSTITDYLNRYPYPILLGQKIMSGDIYKMTLHNYDQTFLFEQTELGSYSAPNAIKKIMHMLIMKKDCDERNDLYTIGRIDKNDIVLVDYTISKQHAKILLREDGYYLVDCQSRNKTILNGSPLIPNRQYKIKEKDIIVFGRIGFVFIRPITFFIRMRILKQTPEEIEHDCRAVINKTSIDDLCTILKTHELGYPKEALHHKSIAKLLIENIEPITLLLALCP